MNVLGEKVGMASISEKIGESSLLRKGLILNQLHIINPCITGLTIVDLQVLLTKVKQTFVHT